MRRTSWDKDGVELDYKEKFPLEKDTKGNLRIDQDDLADEKGRDAITQ